MPAPGRYHEGLGYKAHSTSPLVGLIVQISETRMTTYIKAKLGNGRTKEQ